MDLKKLRAEKFIISNWKKSRPFFCHLSPEIIWNTVRNNIIEEINEEIEERKSKNFEYPTFFTYPSNEQMESVHFGGTFFSEIREVVGYRAAEALSILAGLIRLETKGPALNLFESSFKKLWNYFSKYQYSRGYRTHIVRSNLVLHLSSNNVFDLIPDKRWPSEMLNYFLTGHDEWSGEPHTKNYRHVIKLLGGEITAKDSDNLIVKGVFNLDELSGEDLIKCLKSLWWEQGIPEKDAFMPPIMFHDQRRGSSQPSSDFYYLPIHLIKIQCRNIINIKNEFLADPIIKTALHLIHTLCLREIVVSVMGYNESFTIQQATAACKLNEYTIKMILGQLIKSGLAEFDKFSGTPWNSNFQVYKINEKSKSII